MNRRVVLVAGHGELGGGEVVLLACAQVLRELGLGPAVVAPQAPGTLAHAARSAGHDVVTYPAAPGDPWWRTVRAVRRAVRTARSDDDRALVWCHGLRPAAATAGMPGRIVQVHRVPTRAQLPVLGAAVAGARALVVPSESTRAFLPLPWARTARVLGNWTGDVALPGAAGRPHRPRAAARPEGSPGPGRGVHPDPGPTGPGDRVTGQAPTVGFLGRLSPEKGLQDLVVALERLGEQGVAPAPRVRIAGEPLFVPRGEAAEIAGLLDRAGERVTREGRVERASFLARTDVLVCPSRVPESFGLVAAEAMAARVPVVVSDAGALPEVVGRDHPYTARAGDPESLACVLHRALAELGTPAGDTAVARARRRWETLWSPAAGRERVAALLTDLGVLP